MNNKWSELGFESMLSTTTASSHAERAVIINETLFSEVHALNVIPCWSSL